MDLFESNTSQKLKEFTVSFIGLSFEGDFKRSADDDLKNFIIEFSVEALRLLEIIFSM